MKDSRFFGGFASMVAHHPRFVLCGLAVLTLWFASLLPQLRRDPSPRALLASADPEQAKLEAEAQQLFGSTDNVLVVIVGADDVLQKQPIAYVHALSQALAKMPDIERVDALTRIVWPKPVAEELNLDALDAAPTEDVVKPELLSAASDVVAAAPEVFPQGLASLSELSAGKKLEALVAGAQVQDADLPLIREAVAKARQLSGRLISKNHKHLVVAASLSPKAVKHEDVERSVSGIEHWLESHPPPAGVTVSLSGLPMVRTSLVRHMRADQRILIPGTLIASFVVLALSFRWLPAVLLPILAVGVTALWLLGGMALFGEALNVLNNMLPALVIIIGLNEAVHIIGRYMEEYLRLGDKYEALRQTVRTMGAACLVTTLTSAVGLAALVISRTEMLRRFGMVGAIGLILAYAVTLLVVPAVLSLVGGPREASAAESEKRGLIEYVMARATTASLRKPWVVVAVTVLGTLGAAWEAEHAVVDSSLLDQFSKNDPIYTSTRLLETEFEGVRPLEITIASNQADRLYDPQVLLALHSATEWVSKQKGVIRASDPTEPIAGGWAAIAGRPLDVKDALRTQAQVKGLASLLRERDPRIVGPYLTADGKDARLRVRLSDIGSLATGKLVTALHTRLEQDLKPFPDVRVVFGGDAYLSTRGLDAVVADLSGSILAAASLVFFLLAILLQDARLALLAIPANLVPQVWTLAWMVARGIPLNASSAIIFSLSIGLSVDGSIHLVSRFQEERAHGILITSALVRAVRGTGRNIVVSSVALVLGFSVMLLSNFVPVQRFAELMTVSLAGCVIATLVVQPVLLRLFATRAAVHATMINHAPK
jgi:predicted RND superfamily exporter protein